MVSPTGSCTLCQPVEMRNKGNTKVLPDNWSSRLSIINYGLLTRQHPTRMIIDCYCTWIVHETLIRSIFKFPSLLPLLTLSPRFTPLFYKQPHSLKDNASDGVTQVLLSVPEILCVYFNLKFLHKHKKMFSVKRSCFSVSVLI